MSQANMILFVNRSITPDLGTKWIGHIGWGFRMNDGEWLFGSKEALPKYFKGHPFGTWPGSIPKGKPNGVFVKKASYNQMINELKNRGAGGPVYRYHQYKLMHHPNPNVDAAYNLAYSSKKWGYDVLGNNCLDDTHKILTAYANNDGNFLPWLIAAPVPNAFFDQARGGKAVTLNPW